VGACRRFLTDSFYEGELHIDPNSHEQRPQRRKLDSQGEMAGGLDTAWCFFGQV
jgi:hypothetical protein